MKKQEKKIWLFGIFTACPLKIAHGKCAFQAYREMSALSRWEYIDKLTENEVDEYISLHKDCLLKREMGKQEGCRHQKRNSETGAGRS